MVLKAEEQATNRRQASEIPGAAAGAAASTDSEQQAEADVVSDSKEAASVAEADARHIGGLRWKRESTLRGAQRREKQQRVDFSLTAPSNCASKLEEKNLWVHWILCCSNYFRAYYLHSDIDR